VSDDQGGRERTEEHRGEDELCGRNYWRTSARTSAVNTTLFTECTAMPINALR
jgi:hypothetical protein